MYEDLYDYDHPALYIHLVEQTGAAQAWHTRNSNRKTKRLDRALGWRRARRTITQYLRTASRPRIKHRVAGNSYEIT